MTICTSTSSTGYYATTYSDSNLSYKLSPKLKQNYRSKPMEQIVEANMLKGRVVIFSNRTSLVFKDTWALANDGISIYYVDSVLPGYDNPPSLFMYNYAVVIDALEYLSGMMAKANLIKEALLTLKPNKHGTYNGDKYVIMIAKTPKMVNKLAKKEKYESIENGFLIKNKGKLDGLTIRGIDAEELLITAQFAGARTTVICKDIKTDMACVKIYP